MSSLPEEQELQASEATKQRELNTHFERGSHTHRPDQL